MKQLIGLSLLCISLTACATLTADGEQVITVVTEPAGAACVLSTTQNTWTVESTPGSVPVERAFEPIGISCNKAGYMNARTLLEARTRGRAYGNILLGGIPAYVDAGTGNGYEYETYEVTLTLTPIP